MEEGEQERAPQPPQGPVPYASTARRDREQLLARIERIERTQAFQKSCFKALWGALIFLVSTAVHWFFSTHLGR